MNVYTIHEGHLVHTLSPEGCVSPIADVTFVTISVQGQIAFSVTDKVKMTDFSFIFLHERINFTPIPNLYFSGESFNPRVQY